MTLPIAFTDQDIEVEVRERAAPLVRLFRHAGASFSVPDEQYRNGRYDPPPGHKAEFAVLYTADSIACAAMEARLLVVDVDTAYSYGKSKAEPYKVARLQYQGPALFIRLDSAQFRKKLGVPRFNPDGYLPYQLAALALVQRFGETFDGFSWESMHRGQPGRNYGFWHHRKDRIQLRPMYEEKDSPTLLDDADWQQLLKDHPCIMLEPDNSID